MSGSTVAAEWLLRRDGHFADLTLVVALDPAHHIAAHARGSKARK